MVETEHRSTLKQQNKKHNHGKHRSKRHLSKLMKGRVEKITISKKAKELPSRQFRKDQAKQIRKDKQLEKRLQKAELGSSNAPPFLVTIIPLSLGINPQNILAAFKACPDSCVTSSNEGLLHFASLKYKQRYSFLVPSKLDLSSILDACKVSNTVIFLWDGIEVELSDATQLLLGSLKSQGMPSSFHVLCNADRLSEKKLKRAQKELLNTVSSYFPGETKFHSVKKTQDVELLLRAIGLQKQKKIHFRDQRPNMIAEKITYEKQEGESLCGELKVYGYLRGKALNPNSLVHIPDWGDFQISKIEACSDPHALNKRRKNGFDSEMYEEITEIIGVPNLAEQESLETLKVPPRPRKEDTSPTLLNEVGLPPEKVPHKQMVVPEGTSEYQAHWLSDDEDEDSCSSYSEDDNYMDAVDSDDDGSQEKNTAEDMDAEEDLDLEDNYDDAVDYKEEMDTYAKYLDSQDNLKYPDEVEVHPSDTARRRLAKYRALESFRKSAWFEDDELPVDYSRICKLDVPYDHAKRTILKCRPQGVRPGQYIIVSLAKVPQYLYLEHLETQAPIVLFGMLPLEQKMSVMNVVLESSKIGHRAAIKSKDNLLFHVGYRRFSNRPIFSEDTNLSKHKMLRYFYPNETVVASFYAPLMFAPCPVTVFKLRGDGTQVLIATGRIRNVDPNRIILRRVVLTGEPFKVNKRSAVVRFMFSNREDVEHYKKVQLRTKLGRTGNIIIPLGSHGHMKCFFNGPLRSDDTIKLSLYKRSFPKWAYGTSVPRANCINSNPVSWLVDAFDFEAYREQQRAEKRVRFDI